MRTRAFNAAVVYVLVFSSLWLAGGACAASDSFSNLKWHTRATFGFLQGIALAADGRHGWAVGEHGTILATMDGGDHWARQTSSTPYELDGVAFAADDRHGWAVGKNGTILATTDGGGKWTLQSSSTTNDLRGVALAADGRRGWIVGKNGTILATTDGGETWNPQASPLLDNINGVAFAADGRHGAAVGDGNTILTTADGGGQWSLQIIPASHLVGVDFRYGLTFLYGVAFAADGQHGWAVGNNGEILATADGGNQWTQQISSTTQDLQSVAFAADGRHGWAVGTAGTILATIDGGVHWTLQAGSTPNALFGVAFVPDGRRGFTVGQDGTILATSNSGDHWALRTSSTLNQLRSVAFAPDGLHGWAVGEFGTIIATIDGGGQWIFQTSSTTNELDSVAFAADGRHGWAVGTNGTILATADGGSQWTQQISSTLKDLYGVAFAADGRRGWAVGNNGTILATTDGGDNWTPQVSPTSNALSGVTFAADGRHGWVVGHTGTILASTDGGDKWILQTSSTSYDLNGVAFAADGRHGWAVGNKGTILATADGGGQWTRQTTSTFAILMGVAFAADGRHGWAVGQDGLHATANGGDNWTLQTSSTSEALLGVTIAPDGYQGWAVGINGTIAMAIRDSPVDTSSVSLKSSAWGSDIAISFMGYVDPRLPVWASHVEAKTDNRDHWQPVGDLMREPAGEGRAQWRMIWAPADYDFHQGDIIQHRVLVYAGGDTSIISLGSITYAPWWEKLERLLSENRSTVITVGAPFGLFVLYASGFLVVLVVAPARLASVGAAPLDGIVAPTGNAAFVWSLLRKFWESAFLSWLCRNRRVRRAWLHEYAAGRRKLADLGKFARDRFINEPDLLDTWVAARLSIVNHALASLDLYAQRSIYIPLPLRSGSRLVERPDAMMLRDTFARDRAIVAIVGGGGSGKSTLACAYARWALAADPTKRLALQQMIPIFVGGEITNLLAAVTSTLRQMLGEEELPEDLLRALLGQKRLLIILDAFSERALETQHNIERSFESEAIFNAVIITARTEVQLGAIQRTVLYPLLLDEKHVVPFIVDYVANLVDAKQLQSGRTLLRLGDRILGIAEAGGRATTVPPSLVTLFVDSAMSRARTGMTLDDLPQDVPNIFVDYLTRIHAVGGAGPAAATQDQFVTAACALANVSLGARRVPNDFTKGEAQIALSGFPIALLDAMITGGILESRSFGGMVILRFSLDPAAEFLAAIQAVQNLRGLPLEDVVARVEAMEQIEGYPRACSGYLKAFATCYRTYGRPFRLPDIGFPWEREAEVLN